MPLNDPPNALLWGLGLLGLGAIVLAARSGSTAPTIPLPQPPPGGPGSASLQGDNGAAPSLVLDYGPLWLLPTGTAFAAQLAGRDDNTREALIAKAIVDGQYPAFLHQLVPVPLHTPAGVTGTVTPDFMGVGVGEDWLRTPMRPGTAQRVANQLGMVLPTKAVADAVHSAATQMRMAYVANNKTTTAAYVQANADIQRRLPPGAQGSLIDGQKKNVLAADSRHPGNVVIYGGNSPDTGAWPIQGYNPESHNAGYVDYSHGIRLVSRIVDVDGRGRMDISAVMADLTLAPLVSSGSLDPRDELRVKTRKASPPAGPRALALGAKLPLPVVLGLQEAQEAFPAARVRVAGSRHGVVIDAPYQLLRARPALREALIGASTGHGTDPTGVSWFAFKVEPAVKRNPTRVAPAAVRTAAREALGLLARGSRCCTAVGIARARQLAAGRPVSDADVVKMCSYFARHAVDKRAGWKARATPGYIAWQAWGGDAGRRWACAERAAMR